MRCVFGKIGAVFGDFQSFWETFGKFWEKLQRYLWNVNNTDGGTTDEKKEL